MLDVLPTRITPTDFPPVPMPIDVTPPPTDSPTDPGDPPVTIQPTAPTNCS